MVVLLKFVGIIFCGWFKDIYLFDYINLIKIKCY